MNSSKKKLTKTEIELRVVDMDNISIVSLLFYSLHIFSNQIVTNKPKRNRNVVQNRKDYEYKIFT